ncbi:hypothetical protein UFOVP1290_256 [uncultured Caudovirales phage]|uniref:Uncharacterized protein n=1 Tax=uncultured Caudovirales phage TaxID=2100421 RepID=A0A6J5RR10_9CAUD|nr:hypothetical protein UFOVP1290_256 [uncultured Caudovirales phage]
MKNFIKNGLVFGSCGAVEYWKEDKPHRLDGPAVKYPNGSEYWYVEGKLHREDGPAVHLANGHKEYTIHGVLHRLDGPALEYASGTKSWFYNGKRIYCTTQEEFEKLLRLKAFW